MKKNNKSLNKTRKAFQYTVVGLISALTLYSIISPSYSIDSEAYCPFGGILSFGAHFTKGSMPCNMSEVQAFVGLALVIGVVLFGKLFCAYVCPVGSVIEWLIQGMKRFKLSITINGIWDRILRLGKYVLLFFTAYFTITASELWCRKFGPYYVVLTGFGHDTVFFWGVVTILAVFVGSVIIPFFWCKYVCPLAALSNIIENVYVTASILVVYIGARILGFEIGIVWLLLALVVSGGIIETVRFKFLTVTPFKIKLDLDTCTDCKLCDNACPQGIAVSKYAKVTHPDCNLCLDCVKVCNVEGSISLGPGRTNWLPPTAVVTLFIAALLIANTVQLTTFSERWGDFETTTGVKTFQMRDLRSIKCYGSSRSLRNNLVNKAGILGLDTYVNDHRAIIYYDPFLLDTIGVKKAVFTTRKYNLDPARKGPVNSIAAYQIGIYELWDSYDNLDLFNMFRPHPAILGFITQYGEPVETTIYFDPTRITIDEIRGIIEQETYQKKTKDGETSVSVEFICAEEGTVSETLDYQHFRQSIFNPVDRKFNDYDDVPSEDLMVFEIDFPQAENSWFHLKAIFLVSHVSSWDGIVRFQTELRDEQPVARIYFNPALVDSAQIHQALLSPVLQIHKSDGSTIERENTHKFGTSVRLVELARTLL